MLNWPSQIRSATLTPENIAGMKQEIPVQPVDDIRSDGLASNLLPFYAVNG
jgi:hypothetical protein